MHLHNGSNSKACSLAASAVPAGSVKSWVGMTGLLRSCDEQRYNLYSALSWRKSASNRSAMAYVYMRVMPPVF